MSLSLFTGSHSHQLGIGGIDKCDGKDKYFLKFRSETSVCMFLCMYCMYVCMYVCIYVYMYVCIIENAHKIQYINNTCYYNIQYVKLNKSIAK